MVLRSPPAVSRGPGSRLSFRRVEETRSFMLHSRLINVRTEGRERTFLYFFNFLSINVYFRFLYIYFRVLAMKIQRERHCQKHSNLVGRVLVWKLRGLRRQLSSLTKYYSRRSNEKTYQVIEVVVPMIENSIQCFKCWFSKQENVKSLLRVLKKLCTNLSFCEATKHGK